jgi:hypothetical protein
MAFSDPLSVTITGFNGDGAISLPRTFDSGLKSVYTSADGLYLLVISHQVSGTPNSANYRVRSMFRLDVRKIATDPFNADKSAFQTCSSYLVVDKPAFGFTPTDMKNIALALTTALTTSSAAALLKLVGGEH